MDKHDHSDLSHTHPHIRLPLPGFETHEHATASYLKTGIVGALFTLSPPVSMMVFASTLLPDYGPSVVGLAVLTYAVAITGTMSLIGAGVGVVFGFTHECNAAVHGAAQAAAGVAIATLAATLLIEIGPMLS